MAALKGATPEEIVTGKWTDQVIADMQALVGICENCKNRIQELHVVAYGEPSPPLEERSILLYDDGVARYHYAVQTGQYII